VNPGILFYGSCLLVTLPLAGAELYCSPESPVVFRGESVRLRAWATDPGQTSGYQWSVKAGRLRAEKAPVEWDLTGVEPGRYQAMVTAKAPAASLSCSLEIFYQNQPVFRGPNSREPGRSLMEQGAKEPGGYGMYTYLLFGEPANEGNTERYKKALAAYLSLATPLEQMEAYFDRNQLNIFNVPVTIKPKPKEKLTVDQLLAGYDFARAQSLLSRAGVPRGVGPRLVSSLTPLGGQVGGSVLVQDLSAVPPSIIDLWVRAFLNQAAQGRTWSGTSLQGFLLRTRTVIEIVATGYPQVKAGLEQYVKLVESPK
jgi:hypothetical protein